MLKINIVKGFDDFVLSANVNITHVVGAGWAVVVDAHCEALGHCLTQIKGSRPGDQRTLDGL